MESCFSNYIITQCTFVTLVDNRGSKCGYTRTQASLCGSCLGCLVLTVTFTVMFGSAGLSSVYDSFSVQSSNDVQSKSLIIMITNQTDEE